MLIGALSQFVLVLGGVAGTDLSCKATSNDEFECAMDAMVRDLQIFSFRQIVQVQHRNRLDRLEKNAKRLSR